MAGPSKSEPGTIAECLSFVAMLGASRGGICGSTPKEYLIKLAKALKATSRTVGDNRLELPTDFRVPFCLVSAVSCIIFFKFSYIFLERRE